MTSEQFKPNDTLDKQKCASAIKAVLEQYFHKVVQKNNFGIDISAPSINDVDNMQSGSFEVRDVKTTPQPNGQGLNYHCYIGSTEIHLTGKAAEAIDNLLKS